MMSDRSRKPHGLDRPGGSRPRAEDPRKGRRYAPRAESLERRVTLTGNITMNSIQVVDVNGTPLYPVYADEPFYIQAKFTTVDLPSNFTHYRFLVTTNEEAAGLQDITYYSKYYTDGRGDVLPASFTERFGPIIGLSGTSGDPGGRETIDCGVNPDSLNQDESNVNDNSAITSLIAIGPANSLVFDQSETNTVTAGAPFTRLVDVLDVFGDLVLDDEGPVTIGLASGPTNSVLGGSTTNGTETVNAVDGVATFSGLTLNKTTARGMGVTLSALRDSLPDPQAISPPISVNPGLAAQLAISQEPNAGAVAGNYFGLLVAVEDLDGNVVTTDNTTEVTAKLAGGAGSLMGTTVVKDLNGVSYFSKLIDTTANPIPITLGLSSTGLTGVTSSPVTINPALASQLVIQTQPPSTATVGQPLAPVVYEEDQYNNLETTDNSTVVTASMAGGVGPLSGATVTVSGGVATFSSLADGKAETLALTFAGGNLPKTPKSSPIVVGKATPTITWSPVPLGIGSGLGAAQLDATDVNYGAIVPGKFSYALKSGQALTLGTVLPLGTYPATVTFTPADLADYLPSTGSATIDIQKATNTSLTLSAGTITYKHPITFTVAVSATAGGATPTGSVAFLDGSAVVGSANLDANGHATFSTANLPPSTQSIVAYYTGDPTYAPSTSTAIPLRVRAATVGDFDGDGKADVGIYDQTGATFSILYSGGGSRTLAFGNPADKNIPIAGDFDGDGKTDLAIYDQGLAEFLVLESGGGTIAQPFGNPADKNIPIAGDFDGDGKTDLAIYDQITSQFLVLESGGGSIVRLFGNATHVNVPIAGDFDGDGKTDLAIYDQTASEFLVLESGGGSLIRAFGNATHVNIPIAGDFDGDGKTDLAIYDQTASTFIVLESGGGSIFKSFGNSGDVNAPIAGDFDGDGKTDLAIYDQSAGEFIVLESGGGSLIQPFGNKKHVNFTV